MVMVDSLILDRLKIPCPSMTGAEMLHRLNTLREGTAEQPELDTKISSIEVL